MKATLDRQALQIALAADFSGSGRPILECVKIGNGEIMACDGFIFAKCQIATEPLEGEEILINAKDIIGAARMIQHGNITLESNGGIATLKDEYCSISITAKLQDGKYPETHEMVPKTEQKAYVALSKDILSKILEIAKPRVYRTLIFRHFYGLGILRCTGGWRLLFGFGFIEWGKDSIPGIYLPRKDV
jgi:hypothetical protein